MSLWVDKYRPKKLENIPYNDSVTQNLKALASSGDFPHLLVYGPPGSGKKTKIYATLNELFGLQSERLKIDIRTFTLPSNRKLEFNVLSSPCHLEITPSDMGNNDRIVIQDLLKEVASTEQVDFGSSKNGMKHRFKVVILNEADHLSRDAQAALRRTMEKYSANIRLIMIANTISSIISPIKSRTLLVRMPAPSEEDIASILSHIAAKEAVKFNPPDDGKKKEFFINVARHSDRNLRKALLSFETVLMQAELITVRDPKETFINLDWETVIQNLSKSIFSNRSVANLAKVRVVFYELLAHCIPARIILKKLLFDLIDLCQKKPKITTSLVEIAANFDERLSLGQKSIFHLEGFVAKAMLALENQ